MDRIPDVVTRFIAEVLPYVRDVRRAARVTNDFGDEATRAARQADRFSDEMRQAAGTARLAGAGVGGLGGHLRAAAGHAGRASSSVRALGGNLTSLGARLVKLAAVVGVMSALAGGAASAVIPVLGLVSALAPAAGLFAALPAVILGAVAAINVLKLAVSGMSDAFAAAMAGDVEKFNEALKNLSPAARSVAIDFRSIVPELKSVRTAAQQAFFGPLVGQLRLVARELTGPVRSGVRSVAQEFGSAARDALVFIRSARGVSGIRTILDSVHDGVRALRPALQPVLAGFLAVGAAGSRTLADLAVGAGQVGAAFGRWLQQLAATGQVDQMIRGAIDVLRQLLAILGNVGSIIGSVFEAANASGGGLLVTLERITGQAAQFFRSAEGAGILRSVFAGLRDIGAALGPVFIEIFRAIGLIAPAVGRLAQAMGPVLATAISALAPALAALEPGITAIINGLGGAVRALAPAMVPLAQAISSIMVAVAPLLPVLGQLLASAIMALVPIVMALAPPLATVAQILGAALLQALMAILPAVYPLGMALAQLVAAAAPLLPMLGQLLTQAILALLPVIVALIPPVAQVAGALGQALLQALVAIAPYLPQLAVSIGQLLIALIPLIPPIIQLVIEMAPLIPIVADAIGLMARLATAVMPLLRLAIANLIIQTKGIMIVFKFVWGWIKFYIGSQINAIKGIIGWFAGLPRMLGDWFGRAMGAIKRVFNNPGAVLYNAGRRIVQGLINGIYSMARGIWNAMGWVARTVRNFLPFSPAKVGPLSGSGAPEVSGLRIPLNIARGILRARGAVSRAMTMLAADVGAGFGPGLAIAGAAGGGGGTMIVNHYTTHVEGSVIRERELVDLVQQQTLRRAGRNPDNRLNLPTGR